MKKYIQSTRHLLEHAQRRFVRSRPGSVLILVVALLLLMAIIGTAYMSMAQADRSTAVQHTNNTEIDMLVDGVISIVKGVVTADIFSQTGQYRAALPRYNTGDAGSYHYVDSLGDTLATVNAGTPWIASHQPELQQEVQVPPLATAGVGNMPMWRFVTGPLTGGLFSSPLPPVGVPFLTNQTPTALGPPYTYTQRTLAASPLMPGVFPGTAFPAWITPTGQAVLAADADGDGVADSGLVKLPMGAINGVTYYYAVRIIDNNAAINANTAWQHNPYVAALPAPPNLPGDFFPTNIDLVDLLVGADAVTVAPSGINQLLNFRSGFGRANNPLPAVNPIANWQAYDDVNTTTPRADLPNYPMLEAQWNGLGRRLSNPGEFSTTAIFNALPISESLNLAHNFIVRNFTPTSQLELMFPNSLSTNSTSAISSYSPANTPAWYTFNFGFLQSYLGGGTNVVSLRSLVTTENPLSEFVPSKYRDITPITPIPAVWVTPPAPGGIFLFGDSVSWKGHRFVCINPIGAAAGLSPVDPATPGILAWQMDNDTWIYQPWVTNPTKTAVNSANFGQLLLGYWSVMAEQKRSAVVADWAPPFPAASPTFPTASPDVATPNPLQPSPRMFRNPIRVLPTQLPAAGIQPWQLSPVQTMQLRAALAAVNTIDMRDADDDVTARTVHLTDFSPFTQPNPRMSDVIATVYGNERQPYITKVYATNAIVNPGGPAQQDGFIAFELHNPDPIRPLSLRGYSLATIIRPNTPPSALPQNFNPQVVPWGTDIDWYGADAPIIPAGGYIVVASNDTFPAGIQHTTTVLKSAGLALTLTAGQVGMWVVHNLVPPEPPAPTVPGGPWGALGNELMIFRPRHVDNATGAGLPSHSANTLTAPLTAGPTPLRATPDPHSPYPSFHEGAITGTVYTPNPADMVPVDSYDFTGLNTLLTPDATPSEWYYIRPNGPPTKAWHFVYPGHYVIFPGAATPATPRLVDGTWSSDIPTAGGGLTAALTLAGVAGGDIRFGSANLIAKAEYRDIPLSLNSLDAAGPNIQRASASSAATTAFPYGGFARNGDMLQVPFIGAYRLAIENPAGNPTGALTVLEMNPVTMDAALALGYSQGPLFQEPVESILQPAVPANPQPGLSDPLFNTSVPAVPVENVGRFCPITPIDMNYVGVPLTVPPFLPDDLFPASSGVIPSQWLYHFSTRLFDYLTVQSPQQDYMPEVDPSSQDPDVDTAGGGNYGVLRKYSPPGAGAVVDIPNVTGGPTVTKGVYNAQPFNPRNATEETSSIQGLVNINTASWVVLAGVPWMPPDYPNFNGTANDVTRRQVNINIGMSIAYYRDVNDGTGSIPTRGHGAFKSIFELANVPIRPFVGPVVATNPLPLAPSPPFFRFMLETPGHTSAAGPYNQSQGNITPAYVADTVFGGFKSQFMMMNRISNLVTTRSDSFTAYILVQGWRDADSSTATLAVQRRAAFIIDRSKLLPGGASLTTTNIPTN